MQLLNDKDNHTNFQMYKLGHTQDAAEFYSAIGNKISLMSLFLRMHKSEPSH